jgi:hypothetical protein
MSLRLRKMMSRLQSKPDLTLQKTTSPVVAMPPGFLLFQVGAEMVLVWHDSDLLGRALWQRCIPYHIEDVFGVHKVAPKRLAAPTRWSDPARPNCHPPL